MGLQSKDLTEIMDLCVEGARVGDVVPIIVLKRRCLSSWWPRLGVLTAQCREERKMEEQKGSQPSLHRETA